MSEHREGYTADELGQYVDALSKNVIAYTQRHPMQAAIDIIDKYCNGHHSALDGCECAILIALIKGENK